MMNAKSPRYNPDGSIDMEVLHERHGWIPYTARAGTFDATAAAMHEAAENGDFGEVAPALPIPEIPLERYQSRQTKTINEACHAEIVAGFESSALGAPHQYPFKEEDQNNLLSTFILAKEVGASKPFKCWDSEGVADYRMHTVAQLHQVGQDAEAHKMAALVKANTLKMQIAAATTAAEVEAITW